MGQAYIFASICLKMKLLLQTPSIHWKLGIITKKEAYHSYALREFLKLLTTDSNVF